MFVLRFLVVGGLILLAVAGVMYAFTKDVRYFQFLKVAGKFVVVMVLAILLFMLFERLVMVV